MSIVHVLISPDPAFEELWREAFAGAVDVYRFSTLEEGMQRLTSTQAPLSLVVFERVPHDGFGLTVSQAVRRLMKPPLSTNRMLAQMGIVVVGGNPGRRHDRVSVVSSRDAAVRLVKFGEIESVPARVDANVSHGATSDVAAAGHADAGAMPTGAHLPVQQSVATQPAASTERDFAASVISAIWDSPDQQQPVGARSHSAQPAAPQPARVRRAVVGGGARQRQEVRTPRGTRRMRPGHSTTPVQSSRFGSGLFMHGARAAHGAPSSAGSPVDAAMLEAAAYYQPGQPLPPELGGLTPARQYQRDGETQSSPDVGAQDVVAYPVVAAPVHGTPAGGGMPPAIAHQVGGMLYGSAYGDPELSFSRHAPAQAAASSPMQTAGMHAGHPHAGHPHAGYPQAGHPHTGYPQAGSHSGYAQQSFPQQAQIPHGVEMQHVGSAGSQHAAHHQHAAHQMHGASSEPKGLLARMRSRVSAGEQAPARPSPEAVAAAIQHRAGAPGMSFHAAHQQASANFAASNGILARAESSSAASFG